MKRRTSLRAAKTRDKNNKLVKRGKRVFIINREKPRCKVYQ